MPLAPQSPAHFRFHIEHLLVIVAVVTVALSLFFKAQVSRKFDALDDDFTRLQRRLSGENFMGGVQMTSYFRNYQQNVRRTRIFRPRLHSRFPN